MIVRPLPARSLRLLGFAEEETRDAVKGLACCHATLVRRFGDEKGSKVWHASNYEVKVFGAWLPLVQLLACDFDMRRSEILWQDANMGSRPLPKLMASRRQLSRWNQSSRTSACRGRHTGSAFASCSKLSFGRRANQRRA